MFKQQTTLQQAIPVIQSLLTRYPSWQAQSADWLDTAQTQATQFMVPVPLVGSFSAGKSTLINAVIESRLLSTNIDPETAVPAEIWHSDTESITGHLPNGQCVPMTREQVQNNDVEHLKGGGWIEAALPIERLKSLPHLKLVDMPGWDSGLQAHSTAIDGYANRSLAYGVVVSADEGNLLESVRRPLMELKVRQVPVFVVISKADKKPAQDVQAVQDKVTEEIEKILGTPPFWVCQASAHKKNLDGFMAALQEIERRAEPLFAQNVVQPFVQQLASLQNHLKTLLNSDDLDSEQIANQCTQLQADMQAFAKHLQTETAQLDTRVQPVLGRIQQHMESRLLAQLDTLTSEALSGKDLNGTIGTTLRLAAEEGMRDEFTPEVERYLDRVAEGLPAHFQPSATDTLNLNNLNTTSSTSTILNLSSLLAPILIMLKKLHPAVAVIATVGSLLLEFFANKADRENTENQRREAAKTQIMQSVIPSAVSQACAALRPVLGDYVTQIKQKITDNVQTQQRSHEGALAELNQRLAQGQAAFAQTCAQYRTDLASLQTTIDQLR